MTVEVNETDREIPDKELLTHELSHLILLPIEVLMREWSTTLPEDHRALFLGQLGRGIEEVVDHITQITK